MSPTLKSPLVPVVFVETSSTGKHSATDVIGLHEAILSRRRIEMSQENLIIEAAWPEHVPQVQNKILADEYGRLLKKYGKELMVGIYGEPHTGRLRAVMERIHTAFAAGMPVKRIIELGNAESDHMELVLGDAPAVNGITGAGLDDDDRRPSMSSVAATLGDTGTDHVQNITDEMLAQLISIGFLPKGSTKADAARAQAKLGGGPSAPAAPSAPKGIDEEGDEEQEPAAIDGNLVKYLNDLGWLEPDCLAVARLVRDLGIKQIPDEPLKAMRSFRNAAPRKQLRVHLDQYDPKAVAATA